MVCYMTFKTNITPTGRDFFFNPAGNNVFDGLGLETAVEDPNQAIDLVNALSPPVGLADRASINASVTGVYTSAVVLPDFTTVNCEAASIITSDLINITSGSSQESRWGSLLNFSGDCTLYKIDGQDRVRAIVSSMAFGTFGTGDCVGFDVSGTCTDIFIQLTNGALQGADNTLIKHTATTNTPVDYNIDTAVFRNIDQTLIEYNPPAEADQASLNITSAQPEAAFTTTGSMLFKVMSGRLIVKAEVLQAETICVVEDGARFSLDSQIVFGDILIEDGGVAVMKSIGILIGDITVDAGGVLGINVISHVGSVTNNGTINGIINGVRYGNWIVDIEDTITTETDTEFVPQPDGSGGIELVAKFGGHYQYENDEDESTTTSETLQNKLTLTTPTIPAGSYRLTSHAEITNDSGDKPVVVVITLDSNANNDFFYAPKFADEYFAFQSFAAVDLAAGVHVVDMEFAATSEGGTAKIRRARLELFRIS